MSLSLSLSLSFHRHPSGHPMAQSPYLLFVCLISSLSRLLCCLLCCCCCNIITHTLCIYIYMHTYIYIYIYMYTHKLFIYIYVYTHTSIHAVSSSNGKSTQEAESASRMDCRMQACCDGPLGAVMLALLPSCAVRWAHCV